jgi:peptidyl-prolyl cis-trans isomerase D
MVMKAMRSQMKLILWIVVVAFVVGFGYVLMGTGGGGRSQSKLARGIVGEINGQAISYSLFRERLLKNMETYRQRTSGGDPDDAVTRQIEQETWQNLVSEIILHQQYRRLGIQVSDQEVVGIIKHNPPAELQNHPDLTTNGAFDIQKYQSILRHPQNLVWLREYEGEIRRQLPLQKLRLQIMAGVRVTDQEIRKAFIDKNERVRVSFLTVDPSAFYDPQAQVPPQEIAAYYREHQKDFRAPERAKLIYVLFPKEATPRDLQSVEERIREIHKEALVSGAGFDTLAMNYSEDPGSAAKGGDLGWFGRGQMVPSFDSAAFALKPGQMSKPFKTDFGWHIVRVDSAKTEKGRPMVKARHILLQLKPSEETLADLRTKAEAFAELARDQGFEAAAKAQGLNAVPTSFFSRGYYVPGLGAAPEAVNFAFEEAVGSLSPVLDNRQFYLVAKLAERRKEGVQPLADVERNISMILLREKAMAQARKRAEELRAMVDQVGSLEAAAKAAGIPVDTADFTREDFVPKVGTKNEFFAQAFSLPVGLVSRPVATDQGVYIIRVDQKQPADQNLYAQMAPKLHDELMQKKQTETIQRWFEAVQSKAKIRDYRMGGM